MLRYVEGEGERVARGKRRIDVTRDGGIVVY